MIFTKGYSLHKQWSLSAVQIRWLNRKKNQVMSSHIDRNLHNYMRSHQVCIMYCNKWDVYTLVGRCRRDRFISYNWFYAIVTYGSLNLNGNIQSITIVKGWGSLNVRDWGILTILTIRLVTALPWGFCLNGRLGKSQVLNNSDHGRDILFRQSWRFNILQYSQIFFY